jgi:hypothetical protein
MKRQIHTSATFPEGGSKKIKVKAHASDLFSFSDSSHAFSALQVKKLKTKLGRFIIT